MSKLAPGQAVNDWYKANGTDTRFFTEGPSLCRQEFAEDCDINVLMERYQNDGIMPPLRSDEPYYADFTAVPTDLMSSLQLFDEAQDAFMSLPARVRREFDNDPHQFVAYAADPANVDQMREWGLAAPLEPAAAPAAPPAAEPAPAPAVRSAPSAASPGPPTQSSP